MKLDIRPLTLAALKPRNPYVAPSLMRSAGSHRPNGGSRRQQAILELRRELRTWRQDP